MILIASREEKELIQRLRSIQGLGDAAERMTNAAGLSAEVIALKQQIASLQIDKSRIVEDNAKQERELRHMIGLEKKRCSISTSWQAKRDTSLTVREGNLAVDQETGFTATYESLLRGQSEAVFEARPSSAGASGLLAGHGQLVQLQAQRQQMLAQQGYDSYYQRYMQHYAPSYGSGATSQQNVPAQAHPAPVEDEFGWLRRRVDEMCWKAA